MGEFVTGLAAREIAAPDRIVGNQDAALRGLIKAAIDYMQGCECSGSGVITDCPGLFSEGCCGACGSEKCECCEKLRVAVYEAEEALKHG